MKHYGDITKINGGEVEPVDIITGGSPCQDLSVAGKRAGLAGERSGLFMEQIRVIKEMREHDRSIGRTAFDIRPRFMVWENVPGALSSGTPKGEDFRIVLEETAKVADPDAVIPEPPAGKWQKAGCIILANGGSIAWRIHDAQFWGVPQRRRRIALVADFAGQSAPEILFERKGLSGDPEQSEQAGQGIAEGITASIGETGGRGPGSTNGSGELHSESEGGCEVDRFGKKAGKGALVQTDMSGTLSATQDQTLISVEKQTAFGISAFESNAMKSPNPHSGVYKADTSRTLDNNGGNPSCNQVGVAILEGNGARNSHRGDGYRIGETSYTLNTVEQHAVAVDIYNTKMTGDTACAVTAGGVRQEPDLKCCKAADLWNGELCETNGSLQARASNNNHSNNTVIV